MIRNYSKNSGRCFNIIIILLIEKIRTICEKRPDDYKASYSLIDKIRILKDNGINYSLQGFRQLMMIVNHSNMVLLEISDEEMLQGGYLDGRGFKEELKDNISEVLISERLTKSPILLVAEESGMDINMEKLMKMHNQKTPASKKILEVNPSHPMIVNLANNLTKVDHKKMSNLLLDQANILDGNILSNPSGYLENLTEIFIK